MSEQQRAAWDWGRLIQTLVYFDVIPGLGCLKRILMGGTPEIKLSIIDELTMNPIAGEKMLFDFRQPTEAVKLAWGAVDDVVMGGVSASGLRFTTETAIFTGNVSTANNGGFASVRTRNFSPPWDLSSYEGLELRVKGDGKRYKLISRCEGQWDGIGYCYSFDTVYDFWTTIRIPFRDLIPVFRAKTVSDAGIFDSSKVYSLQLMLSKFEYDGALNPKFEPGVFGLEIEYIKAYEGGAVSN